jgi:hypothetical protein
MENKVKIAWLEQSGQLQDRADLKRNLEQVGVDFYRLNWRLKNDDPFSNVDVGDNVRLSWSKGRERLYAAASINRNEYDYYIFADDDLVLDRPVPDFIKRVKEVLLSHRPCILTVQGLDSWQEKYIKKTGSNLVSIFIVDLQFQCLGRKAANFAFPAKFDGGWGTLWYPMLFCNQKPGSVISIRDMQIKNISHAADGEYGGQENKNTESIWHRSEPYMSRHARILSRIIGHRKTILFLNYIYSRCVMPE